MGREKYLPTTLNQFLMIYSPSKVQSDLRQVKTVRDAIMVKTPSLAKIRKQYGGKQIEAYIKIWLIELNEFINVARPLKEPQIDECARLIMSEYWGLTVADINLIFKTAKMGGYGELYSSLSINSILGWFGEYCNKRLSTAGEMSREGHDRHKYQYGVDRNRQFQKFHLCLKSGFDHKESLHAKNTMHYCDYQLQLLPR